MPLMVQVLTQRLSVSWQEGNMVGKTVWGGQWSLCSHFGLVQAALPFKEPSGSSSVEWEQWFLSSCVPHG